MSALIREWGDDDAARRSRQQTADGARCTVVDRDRCGRRVAICTINGRDLGRTLVQEGLAMSESNFGDPYRQEEERGETDREGMWR